MTSVVPIKPIKNVSGFSPGGMSFVSGHDFSRADQVQKNDAGSSPCGMSFVSGHDFSRAINPKKQHRALAPAGQALYQGATSEPAENLLRA